jgi:CrcB protein
MTVIYIAIGGALGSVLRYFLTPFIGTMYINITGSFIMGIMAAILQKKLPLSLELKSLIMIGLLGGYTTFSSFSLDILTMVEQGSILQAIIYAILSVILSIAAISLSFYATKYLLY